MDISPASLALPSQIQLNLQAGTATQAIAEVAGLLRQNPLMLNFPAFCEELFDREKLSPTALGRGVAFPHARTTHVSGIVLAIGRSVDGIWHESAKEKVHLFFVIGTPREAVRDYLSLIAKLTALLRPPTALQQWLAATSSDDIIALLKK